MYDVSLILHFTLMLLWVLPAFYLNYKLLKNYPDALTEERLSLLKNVQTISDRTELPASSFIPLVGALMIIDQTFFLKMGIIHLKILLALVAIGLYHMTRGRLRRIITAMNAGESVKGQGRQLILMRIITLMIVVSVVLLIFTSIGYFRTVNEIGSLFN